jgi:hypothetical protein
MEVQPASKPSHFIKIKAMDKVQKKTVSLRTYLSTFYRQVLKLRHKYASGTITDGNLSYCRFL